MSVYPVLKRKIEESDISISTISMLIGISSEIFVEKLNGIRSFYFYEALIIRDILFPDFSLQELFQKVT